MVTVHRGSGAAARCCTDDEGGFAGGLVPTVLTGEPACLTRVTLIQPFALPKPIAMRGPACPLGCELPAFPSRAPTPWPGQPTSS